MRFGSASCGDFQGKVLDRGDHSDKADTLILISFKSLVTFDNGLYQKFVLCEIKTYIPDLISRNPRRVS